MLLGCLVPRYLSSPALQEFEERGQEEEALSALVFLSYDGVLQLL